MRKSTAVLIFFVLAALPARAEFPVTGVRPLAPTLGISSGALVVATDEGFLAFWKTRTTNREEGLTQIAKLSSDGTLLRRTVAWDLPASFWFYDGASNGVETLLAGVCSGTYGSPLCLARFSADGDFVGLIETRFSYPVAPVVASNGDGFLVSFSLARAIEVVALPVTRDGLLADRLLLAAWDPSSQWTSPAAIGESYFVAFGQPGKHRLARLSETGVDASVPLTAGFEISQVRIAGSGDRLLVIASPKGNATADLRLRAAVFDRDLTRLTEWMPLEGGSGLVLVGPTSTGWLVAASGLGEATVLPISRTGLAGEPARVGGVLAYDFDFASSRDRAAIVWTSAPDYTIPEFPFSSARVAVFDSSAIVVREATPISLGPAPQIHPAAAHASGVTLAAWVERTMEERLVVKARPFDGDGGVPLAPAVTMPLRGWPQSHPSVATDGTSFFIVWSEGASGRDGVCGARVTADGRVLDATAMAIFGSAEVSRAADAVWGGDSWVVVSSEGKANIVAKRVSSGGNVIDAVSVVIAPGPERGGYDPRIDCSGDECLVVWKGPWDPWECRISPCAAPPSSILAARISPALALLDATPLRLNGENEWVSALSVSWNELANAWSVAWSLDGRRRVSRDGRILDELLTPASFLSGEVFAISEAHGWHLTWTSSSSSKVFHGWSASGGVREVATRYTLTRTPEREWDPQLVGAQRPLAFVVRESQITAGSPGVIGRFLDEATEPISTDLDLSVRRLPDRVLEFSWTTDIDVVSRFVLWGRYGAAWKMLGGLAPNARIYQITETGATAYRLSATTPSGAVESNVIELGPLLRRRTAIR